MQLAQEQQQHQQQLAQEHQPQQHQLPPQQYQLPPQQYQLPPQQPVPSGVWWFPPQGQFAPYSAHANHDLQLNQWPPPPGVTLPAYHDSSSAKHAAAQSMAVSAPALPASASQPRQVSFTAASALFSRTGGPEAGESDASMAIMAAAINSLEYGQAATSSDDSWVREAEAHFASVAPPASMSGGESLSRPSMGATAATENADVLAALAVHQAGHPDFPWLPAAFVDPVPVKHRGRLQRALATNMEYVLQKDVEERQRAIEALKHAGVSDDGDVNAFSDAIHDGRHEAKHSRYQRRNQRLCQEKRTGGIGSADAPTGPRDSRHAAGQGAVRGFKSGDYPHPNTAVYVSGLPPSVNSAQLEQLFSPYGRVRRIKIYKARATTSGEGGVTGKVASVQEVAQDQEVVQGRIKGENAFDAPSAEQGDPKGDALVAFIKPGSVGAAIKKLDGMELTPGDGYHISVQAADFSHKEKNDMSGVEHENDCDAAPDELLTATGVLNPTVFDEDGVPLFQPLPPECRAADRPTCVLRNLYTMEQISGRQPQQKQEGDFLKSLEAEILVECLKFGSVVCCLTLPDAPYYYGAVLVTFGRSDDDVTQTQMTVAGRVATTITPTITAGEATPSAATAAAVVAAQACGDAMDGRLFDGLTIRVQALGNWGEGEITPPIPAHGEDADAEEEAALAAAAAAAAPALDEFFSGLI